MNKLRTSIWARILPPLTSALFFFMTVMVLAPLEIVSFNVNDFHFGIKDFRFFNSAIALLLSICVSVMLAALPGKLGRIGYTILFSASICLYLQAMFLNGHMESMQGQRTTYPAWVIFVNLAVWLIIFALCIAGSFLVEECRWRLLVIYVSLFLFLIQSAAAISIIIKPDLHTAADDEDYYATTDDMFEVSSQGNVIVFISDTFDGRVMDTILADDPRFLDAFRGFTYYPDCTSTYSRTYPAIVYLMTREKCYFDSYPWDYIAEAYSSSEYFHSLVDAGINIGIYTNTEFVSQSAAEHVVNYSRTRYDIDHIEMLKLTVKMALYRDVPYAFKNRFHYDYIEINGRVWSESPDQPEMLVMWYDEWFRDRIDDTGLSIDKSIRNEAFRFYHLGGLHIGDWDWHDAAKSLETVEAYCERLKELGLYESSTIIVTADHGYSGAGYPEYMPHETAAPIMLVKPPGVGDEADLMISEASVSHDDLFATIQQAFGIENDGEPAIWDVDDGDARRRIYYHTALPSDEIGEIELREFEVVGDARIPDSYVFTGNAWDILYSGNHVCEHKDKYR